MDKQDDTTTKLTRRQQAVAEIIAKDPDFYKRIGAIGGRKGTTGGFYADRDLARRAGSIGGKIGGKISKRKSKKESKL